MRILIIEVADRVEVADRDRTNRRFQRAMAGERQGAYST